VLLPFDRPIDLQPDRAMGRELDEGLQEHRLGQVSRLQALVVEQARQPLRCRFLIAKAASQLGLTAGLLVNKGLHKIPRLLLDSRVVDVPMAYNPTCVIFSSLKPLFFNNLKNESCFSDHVGA
jgi:hypothetical protein